MAEWSTVFLRIIALQFQNGVVDAPKRQLAAAIRQ